MPYFIRDFQFVPFFSPEVQCFDDIYRHMVLCVNLIMLADLSHSVVYKEYIVLDYFDLRMNFSPGLTNFSRFEML